MHAHGRRGCREAIAQRDAFAEREDERERQVLTVDLTRRKREPRHLIGLIDAEAQKATRRRVRIRIPDHA